MFSRDIIGSLSTWRQNPRRKPLILRGARQVGKTTAVRLFSQGFERFIYLNLEKPEDRKLFELHDSMEDLLTALFFTRDMVRTGNGETLVFIDEIQNCPPAVARLRYFYEESPELYVIAAGSLLESLINRQISFPVGRVEFLAMRPLTFLEFLAAQEETQCLEVVRSCPVPAYAHDRLLKLFRLYTLIGGMPEVIDTYAQSRDLHHLKPVFENLMVSYLDDVEKYARNDNMTRVIRHTVSAAFQFGAQRIRFQGFGKSNYRSKEISESFRVLEKAMLLYLLYPSTSVKPPMQPDLRKSPRLQLLDTGLMNYFAGVQKEFFGTGGLDEIFEGRVIEHMIAQELLGRLDSPRATLHFWVREKKQSNAEVDFIIPYENHLIPAEVKSGSSGRLRSLHLFMDRCDHPFALRFWPKPLALDHVKTLSGKPFQLLSLPYYLAGNVDTYLKHFLDGSLT